MASCGHLEDLVHLQPPKLSQSVHREECTQCFDSQDDPSGIDVCLSCFNGGCLDEERHHARTHFRKSGHNISLNIQRKIKPSVQRDEDAEPPAKITKLAIVPEREEDKYDTLTALTCWACDPQRGRTIALAATQQTVTQLVNAVMKAMSAARQSEVQAWEEEVLACEHTLMLQQTALGHIPASGLAHCGKCDLKENLWLCMTCGSLGCGRKQFGGAGGNSHGLQHFEETGHGISVKLGTITPEGGADIYCYICNDSKLDPELSSHLATFGINVQTLSKTEKTMTELNIEHNLQYDFSLTSEDGKALESLFGPGLVGFSNLGNSCYMSSVLQTLFALPAFQARYAQPVAHAEMCTAALPADCVECQMHKIADGLLSGRYARAPGDEGPTTGEQQQQQGTMVFQTGIRPAGFKALVGRGHPEFATMRQQDAEEFLVHLLDVLRRDARRVAGSENVGHEPTEVFTFGMEQRLQCGACKRVRYRIDNMDVASVPVPAQEKITEDPADQAQRNAQTAEGEKKKWEPVPFETCLAAVTAPEALEYTCPACGRDVIATKQSRFATFPAVLVIHAKKFQLVNWVPTKLDIPLVLPSSNEVILDEYIGRGIQPGEEELPDDSRIEEPQFDAGAMGMLQGMGFPTLRCKKALLATGNGNDAEAAMEWLFAHMEDPDIDEPIRTAGASGGNTAPEPSAGQVEMLAEMGFTHAQARKALRETSGNAERAIEWLFSHPGDTGEETTPSTTTAPARDLNVGGSKELPARYRLKAFISHKGPSVHSGHYVAHVRIGDEGKWVLFNDEKVVRADEESVAELKKLAYLYVFERV